MGSKTPPEVRNGFFDSAIANNEKHPDSPPLTHRDASGPSKQKRVHSVEHNHAVGFPPELVEWFHLSRPASRATDTQEKTKKELFVIFIHRRFPSRVIRRVLKCTLAFLLSTLFSLIDPIAHTFGRASFLVTTGMLFSHPGRTMGAQIDATIMSVSGIGLAILYAYAALAAAVTYNVHHLSSYEAEPVGNVANAIFLFFGVLLSQILRQRWPKFFYFSLQFMIVQVFAMTWGIYLTELPYELPPDFGFPLLIGCGISFVVNLVVWPETAIDSLGRAIKETIENCVATLDLITPQFLLNPETEVAPIEQINTVSENMQKSIVKLQTAYREAKYEVSYSQLEFRDIKPIRKSLVRLAHRLGALCRTLHSERELFESTLASLRDVLDDSASDSSDDSNTYVYEERGSPSHSRPASVMDQERNQITVSSLHSYLNLNKFRLSKVKPPQKPKKRMTTEERGRFINYLKSLRDPLNALSRECSRVLQCTSNAMTMEFDIDDDSKRHHTWRAFLCNVLKIGKKQRDTEPMASICHDPKHCECPERIRKALAQFDKEECGRMENLDEPSEKNIVSVSMQDELFLVFFFIFMLREVASELGNMSKEINRLKNRQRKQTKRLYLPYRLRSFKKWASWNNHQSTSDKGGFSHAALTQFLPEKNTNMQEEYRRTQLQAVESVRRKPSQPTDDTYPSRHTTNSSSCKGTELSWGPTASLTGPSSYQEQDHSEPIPNDTQSVYSKTSQHPMQLPYLVRARYTLWSCLRYFEKYEFKFALKLAVAVSVLCLPAFVPTTSEWYLKERCQWASITVIAIMNPTSGGTLQASLWRVLGTVIGALTAWAALETGRGSPYIVALFGVLLALPFFYIHLASTYNKIGVVVLISYNVVALTQYVQQSGQDTIASTVWTRTAMVIVGIVVAMILNSLVWPFVARHATRKSLAGVLQSLSDYYTFLVGTFLYHDLRLPPTPADVREALKIERKIYASINAATVLLTLTDHEPRLKGPFPKAFYREMINASHSVLYHLESIRVALTKMPAVVKLELCSGEHYFYRRDMTATMLLTFYAITCSLASKMPLTLYLPSMRTARNRLISHRQKVNEKINQKGWVIFRNLTWYAMSSSNQEIIEELEHLACLVRCITGESKYADRARRIDSILKPSSKETSNFYPL